MSTRRVDGISGDGDDVGRGQPAFSRGAVGTIGRYRTPWGEGTVMVSKGRLVGVELPDLRRAALPSTAAAEADSLGSSCCGREVAPADWVAVDRWVRELEAYFRGERLAWTLEEAGLKDLVLGEFEGVVYTTLLTIPPAVTVSYGVLAEMAGHPRAARAVGNAMAANPIPVVVPCHRVIRADGSLGNYGSDPAWKERLLTHERIHTSPAQ